MTAVVDTAGFVDGMDPAQYHAHPALSSTGLRELLRAPARFRWRRDHQPSPTREMELGTCLHAMVLECRRMFAPTDVEDWRTKEAKAQIEEIELQGLMPVKPSENRLLMGMDDALGCHPLAGPLLDTDRGVSERALFWRDEATGVECRALVDFMPVNRRSLVDLKTTTDASPAALPRHMARYGYPIQAAFYLRGAKALDLVDESAGFVWVFVERDPPHLVSVVQLPPADLQWADERVTAGLERYRDCVEVGVWPGYPDGLLTVALPAWARRDFDEGDQW